MTAKQELQDSIDRIRAEIDAAEDILSAIPEIRVRQDEKPYHYIVAWGLYMLSFGYYVDAQVRKARQDDAPDTAYAWDVGGTTKGGIVTPPHWRTIDELKKETVDVLKSYVSVLKRETA